MDTKNNPENLNQRVVPEDIEALQREAVEPKEAERTPEQIIEEFEAETAKLRTRQNECVERIKSAQKSKEDYTAFGHEDDERVKELDDFIAGKESLAGALFEEIARRSSSEAEMMVEGEIGEIDNRIAAQETKKGQVGFSAYPEQERAEIGSRIAQLQAEKERKQAQLQVMQLKRIHDYGMRRSAQKLYRQKGWAGGEVSQMARQEAATKKEKGLETRKESARSVLQREVERAAEAREEREAAEKKDKWGWVKRTLRAVAPAGIYAFVKERRAVMATSKDIAAQLKAQEHLVLTAMVRPEQKGLASGFQSERARQAELARVRKGLKEALGISPACRVETEKEILERFNQVRLEVSREFVGEDEKAIDVMVDRATKVLTSKLGPIQERYGRGRELVGADLANFKAELRKRLEMAQNDQLVIDTKAYAKLVKEALNAGALDREVFQPLQEVAGEATIAA